MTLPLPRQALRSPLLLLSDFGPTLEATCGHASSFDAILVQKLAHQHDPPECVEHKFTQAFHDEALDSVQANLREKTKQMKAMASELNMYQAQVNEYKYQIERLTRDLNDMKRKYLEQRRREQVTMERDRSLKPQNLIAAVGGTTPPESMPKFVGGGFSLSTAAS